MRPMSQVYIQPHRWSYDITLSRTSQACIHRDLSLVLPPNHGPEMQPVLIGSGPHSPGPQLPFRATTYVSWEAHHRGHCTAVLWTKPQERKVHMDGFARTPSASSCWSSKWNNTVRERKLGRSHSSRSLKPVVTLTNSQETERMNACDQLAFLFYTVRNLA